jgi:lipopolysaccharide heptosyltransferase II
VTTTDTAVVPPRILVVRFSSMGDIILTTPLLRALRARHPAASISFLTKRSFAPLLSDNPALTDLIVLERGQSLASVAGTLRAQKFTHIVDLHGTLRARTLRFLVPGRWRGYRKRRIEREILIIFKRNVYRDDVPEPERYFEAAEGLDVVPDGGPPEVFTSAEASARSQAWLAAAGLGGSRPLVAVAPGAAHFTKRWPVESWRQLVALLAEAGLDVAVVGGADYAAECAVIAAGGGDHAASSAGRFGLQETAALLRSAAVSVSGDTGVMHMATATRTPVVALMGPTVAAFGFYPYRARARVLERDLACRPCSRQGGARCPLGHHHCLREIDPGSVAAAVQEFAK